ncbi:MAG TPA: molybdopterin-dependent oxidoreductase [Ktedonobacteraceae bacterium]|nr:molybdopterin-dependent oxidoreductase [Ktedonobacteraceae bacterium]
MQTIDESSSAQGGRDKSRPYTRLKQLGISAFVALCAGLVASLTAVLLMGILRLAAGVPTPVELFGDRVLKLMQAGPFVLFLIRFGSHAKTAPPGLAVLGMIGLGTVLGLLYAAIVRVQLPASGYRPARWEWLTALVFALVMTLAAIVLFWNETPQNFLGLPYEWARFVTCLALLADFGLYALILCLAYRGMLPKQRSEAVTRTAQNRRQLLARAGVAVLGVGAAGGTVGIIKGLLNNFTSYDGTETFPAKGFTAPITPTSEHYTVTQNAVDPTPNLDVWRLEFTGLVGNSGIYTFDELQNLPSTSRAVTLECISNGPGGHLMSTAIWQGITFQSLLAKHGGALPGARYVAFYSVDGYSISQPLDVVVQSDALLAWSMNGAALPKQHGYPLRALIPGRYGEENPKWLTRVELTDHFVGGLYADQGWYNGPLHTITRIDRPFGKIALSPSVEIGGLAFAGNRGIQQVEISADGGLSWNIATLQTPLSQDAWVFWTWQWTPQTPGSYTLVARATDGTGALQTSKKQGTVPNAATGYHSVVVQVG